MGLGLEEVWDATPAQLFLYYDSYLASQEVLDYRNASLCQTVLLPHLDPGDKKEGRPPAEPPNIRGFLLFRRKHQKQSGSLNFKQRPGGDHNLYGARADRGSWEAYASKKRNTGTGGKPKWVRSTREKSSGR